MRSTTWVSSGVAVTATPGTTYVWQMANLAPGQSGFLTVTGQITQPLAAGVVIANTATIATADLEQLIHRSAYYRWHHRTAAENGQRRQDWSI